MLSVPTWARKCWKAPGVSITIVAEHNRHGSTPRRPQLPPPPILIRSSIICQPFPICPAIMKCKVCQVDTPQQTGWKSTFLAFPTNTPHSKKQKPFNSSAHTKRTFSCYLPFLFSASQTSLLYLPVPLHMWLASCALSQPNQTIPSRLAWPGIAGHSRLPSCRKRKRRLTTNGYFFSFNVGAHAVPPPLCSALLHASFSV